MLGYIKSMVHKFTAPGQEAGSPQPVKYFYTGPESKVKEQHIKQNGGMLTDYPSIIMVYAPWCGHCQGVVPTYLNLAKALDGHFPVLAVNSDDPHNEDFLKANNIRGFPTMLFADDIDGNRSIKEIDMRDTSRDLKGFVDKICMLTGSGENCCGDVSKEGRLDCKIKRRTPKK